MSKIKSVTFPHQDKNYWLTIDVGGQRKPQYPSPLEVKMMIEGDRQAFEEATMTVLDKYFDNLLGFPDPQIMKKEVKIAVRAIYQGNK